MFVLVLETNLETYNNNMYHPQHPLPIWNILNAYKCCSLAYAYVGKSHIIEEMKCILSFKGYGFKKLLQKCKSNSLCME